MRVRVERGWVAPGLVSVVVVPVLVLWIWWFFIEPPLDLPDDHVAAADSRVCRQTSGNNLPLADAARYFHLVLPRGATHVVFSASEGGLQGEANLQLRFTTTSAGLSAFLSASQLARPTATTAVTMGGWITMGPGTRPTGSQGPCGLNPPANRHVVYSQDGPESPMGSSPRSVAVDMTDPGQPTVWVSALDL